MPSPCTASSHAISVKAFRWRIWKKNTCSDHVTRNALAPRGIMRPTDKAAADSRSVYSFAIIKNTGHGIEFLYYWPFSHHSLLIRARNRLSVWDWPVYSLPLPHRHSFSIFSEGRGRLYTVYLKRIIHLQTVCKNWRIKSGGLFIQN